MAVLQIILIIQVGDTVPNLPLCSWRQGPHYWQEATWWGDIWCPEKDTFLHYARLTISPSTISTPPSPMSAMPPQLIPFLVQRMDGYFFWRCRRTRHRILPCNSPWISSIDSGNASQIKSDVFLFYPGSSGRWTYIHASSWYLGWLVSLSYCVGLTMRSVYAARVSCSVFSLLALFILELPIMSLLFLSSTQHPSISST